MLNINFISNLPIDQTSGGWSGISARIFEELNARCAANFVGPINPSYPVIQKAISKLKRIVGLPGAFTLFAENRLVKIAESYEKSRHKSADFDFFHGATPWTHCQPKVPYGTYLDLIFPQYLEIYSTPNKFSDADITRIVKLEKNWLNKATAVFFGSNWMRQEAIKEYQLDPKKCHLVWVGGNVPIPNEDKYDQGLSFLFISLNFSEKGGYQCVEAIEMVSKQFPAAELIIIGERPPEEILHNPKVKYAGFFRKTEEDELKEFCGYLSQARALIHPTRMDANPLVLVEAGYFFCPSISTRKFGIPELVLDGETGYLLSSPRSSEELGKLILQMCRLKNEEYEKMRKAARQHSMENLTWDLIGAKIYREIATLVVGRAPSTGRT